MADVGMRDLGAFVPGRRGSEPAAPPLVPKTTPPLSIDPKPSPAVIVTPAPQSAPRAVFGADLTTGVDSLGIDASLAQLADLVVHRGTAAPVCVGLLGGPGSGKSFALQRLVIRIGALAAAAASAGRGPFFHRLHVQSLDASSLEGDPAGALAAQLHAGLRRPYPDLAREVGHVARDPQVVAYETNAKLDEARRLLDGERRTLDESGSRRARLTETVLYEAAGSQVDSYARAHRAGLENRLNAFGITGDPIRNYKDLVRVVAESGPLGLSVRALYGFKGQTRLIVFAILFALIGYGFGVAIDTQDSWLAQLRAGPQAAVTSATWLAAHMDLLALARKGATILAALAIAINLWRAFVFIKPILTGARLLKDDLDNRRRDLDGLYAHQTKRVDGLTADVERLTEAANEAERRAGASAKHAGFGEPSPFEMNARSQAQAFFAALGRLIEGGPDHGATGGIVAPQRIVLALDHLDAVAPEQGKRILETLHRIAAESGIVTLVAVDPVRLATATPDLERWIQVPFRLDAEAADRDYAEIVQQALGHGATSPAPEKLDATRSLFDVPVSEKEAALLAAVAPIAGTSPRAVKRFVNLYTLARLDHAGHAGALALMLALEQGGTQAERQTVEEATAGDPGAAFEPRLTSARLRAALDSAEKELGRISKSDIAKAASRAARFSLAATA